MRGSTQPRKPIAPEMRERAVRLVRERRGEYRQVAAGTTVTIRRDGDRLLVNVHGSGRPEMSFGARSETRFASAPIFTLEFQLDGQGKATGATWETAAPAGMASQRIPLERR